MTASCHCDILAVGTANHNEARQRASRVNSYWALHALQVDHVSGANNGFNHALQSIV